MVGRSKLTRVKWQMNAGCVCVNIYRQICGIETKRIKQDGDQLLNQLEKASMRQQQDIKDTLKAFLY